MQQPEAYRVCDIGCRPLHNCTCTQRGATRPHRCNPSCRQRGQRKSTVSRFVSNLGNERRRSTHVAESTSLPPQNPHVSTLLEPAITGIEHVNQVNTRAQKERKTGRRTVAEGELLVGGAGPLQFEAQPRAAVSNDEKRATPDEALTDVDPWWKKKWSAASEIKRSLKMGGRSTSGSSSSLPQLARRTQMATLKCWFCRLREEDAQQEGSVIGVSARHTKRKEGSKGRKLPDGGGALQVGAGGLGQIHVAVVRLQCNATPTTQMRTWARQRQAEARRRSYYGLRSEAESAVGCSGK